MKSGSPPLGPRSALLQLEGIGPQRAAAYRSLGIDAVEDLLRFPPRSYRRFAAPVAIGQLVEEQRCTVQGVIQRRRGSGRRRRAATQLDLSDGSPITALLFGPSYLVRAFRTGEEVRLEGALSSKRGKPVFLVRHYLHEDELIPRTGEIWQPQYKLPEGLPARLHRRCVLTALQGTSAFLQGVLPRAVLDEVGPGAGLAELFRWLHQPQSAQQWQRAGRVLGFEELVRMQEGLLRLRRRRTLRLRPSYEGLSELLQRYRRSLPFELNAHQNAALQEVAADLQADQAMSRMLTGDVGSGKTVVACFPLLVAAHHGLRGALLVPTEILARQHVETLRPILQEWQLPAPVLLSRGSDASAEEGLVLVGTHRLISARLTLPDLAVVVVDEQHKFGVRQRFHLWNKGVRPDLLLASATPIPRTLALTLFGHMDHSQLSEPVRPRKVTTEVLHGAARSQLADRIAQEAQSGGRVFVVCPAVARSSSRANLPSAEQMAPWLRQRLPPSCVVAMVHGRLDPKDKIDRLQEFAAGRCQVLVATVVVEVGLDIPDASMAVILGAERFGLAQLHQIRGRVGRSGRPASCLVVSAQPSTEVLQRLRSFAAVENGFELAERDLQQRGPGELLGLRQHGIFRTRFPVDFSDTALLERARDLARARLGGPKPLQKKEFRSDGVASDSWIW